MAVLQSYRGAAAQLASEGAQCIRQRISLEAAVLEACPGWHMLRPLGSSVGGRKEGGVRAQVWGRCDATWDSWRDLSMLHGC